MSISLSRYSPYLSGSRLVVTLLAFITWLDHLDSNNIGMVSINDNNNIVRTQSYSFKVLAVQPTDDTSTAAPPAAATTTTTTTITTTTTTSTNVMNLAYCFNRLNGPARDLYRRGVKSLMNELSQFCLIHNCTGQQLEQIVYCASFDIFEHYCRVLLLQNTRPSHLRSRLGQRDPITSAYRGGSPGTLTPVTMSLSATTSAPKDQRDNRTQSSAVWLQLLQSKSRLMDEAQLREVESSMEALLAKSLAWIHQDQDDNSEQLC